MVHEHSSTRTCHNYLFTGKGPKKTALKTNKAVRESVLELTKQSHKVNYIAEPYSPKPSFLAEQILLKRIQGTPKEQELQKRINKIRKIAKQKAFVEVKNQFRHLNLAYSGVEETQVFQGTIFPKTAKEQERTGDEIKFTFFLNSKTPEESLWHIQVWPKDKHIEGEYKIKKKPTIRLPIRRSNK